MQNPVPRKWTVDAYLEYEQETGLRHEYLRGEIYAMSGGTDKHVDIISNVNTSFSIAVREMACRSRPAEMKVKVNFETYFYPAVSVICGKPQYETTSNVVLLNPTIVVEVTSKSSETFDKGLKAILYRSLPSLQAYLVIDQNQVFAQLSTRQDSDSWVLRQYTSLDQSIPLPTINHDLPLSDVYRDVIDT